MKNIVRAFRSVLYFPLEILPRLGVSVYALKPLIALIVAIDKPLRNYLLGGQREV